MPFCPNCKYEYRDGFTKCADCGSKLVEVLKEHEDVSVKLIPLDPLPGRIYAEMIKEVLEKKSIFCLIESGPLFSLGSTGTEGDASIIFVPDDKLEEAKEIIKELSTEI